MKTILIILSFLIWGGEDGFVSARKEEHVRVLRPLEQCERVTDLNKWIERVEVIPLDKVEGITVWSRKILLVPGENIILWDNRNIAFFDAIRQCIY